MTRTELPLRLLPRLARRWPVFALRAALALACAAFFALNPAPTFYSAQLVFGGYALLDGALSLFIESNPDRTRYRWALLIEGLGGFLLAFITLVAAGLSPRGLVQFIALWLVLRGLTEAVAGLRLRAERPAMFGLLAAGGAALLGGVLLFALSNQGILPLQPLVALALAASAALLLLTTRQLRAAAAKLEV
ncbi:MAG: DUF308 domain-containing protein [Thermoflexales bacterium]|nr:DUF308 domain-containing protein [Thermoflexales bacterium]